VKVFLNTSKIKGDPRKLVEAKLIKDFPTTVHVQLPDGNIIKRSKSRDLPEEKK
jgi:hypothetical protein